jgi:hypothetical protein
MGKPFLLWERTGINGLTTKGSRQRLKNWSERMATNNISYDFMYSSVSGKLGLLGATESGKDWSVLSNIFFTRSLLSPSHNLSLDT